MDKKAKKGCHEPVEISQKDWISQLLGDESGSKDMYFSCRWRNFWKPSTGRLNFDVSDTMRFIFDGKKGRRIEASNIGIGFNQVLDSNESSSLEQLRITFDLGKSHATAVDKWLDIAFVKRVQKLELDPIVAAGCYVFR